MDKFYTNCGLVLILVISWSISIYKYNAVTHYRYTENSDRNDLFLGLWYMCNGVVKYAWLGLPGGHVRCPAPGNRQPYIDIATET